MTGEPRRRRRAAAGMVDGNGYGMDWDGRRRGALAGDHVPDPRAVQVPRDRHALDDEVGLGEPAGSPRGRTLARDAGGRRDRTRTVREPHLDPCVSRSLIQIHATVASRAPKDDAAVVRGDYPAADVSQARHQPRNRGHPIQGNPAACGRRTRWRTTSRIARTGLAQPPDRRRSIASTQVEPRQQSVAPCRLALVVGHHCIAWSSLLCAVAAVVGRPGPGEECPRR